MSPSLLDIFSSLSLTMTVTLVALGLQNLVVAASRDATARLIRGLTWVNLVAVGASSRCTRTIGCRRRS